VFVGRTDEDEKLHLNQKPQNMLRHFLRLIVDKNTTVLDPTCGSGSALAAALQLGSPRVLGVELDAGNADVARHVIDRDGGRIIEDETNEA
jgi:DNA modification methylase